MSDKSILDHVDYFPLSHQALFAAQLFAVLKFFGELQAVTWKFVLFLWAFGITGTLIRAALKRERNLLPRQDRLETQL